MRHVVIVASLITLTFSITLPLPRPDLRPEHSLTRAGPIQASDALQLLTQMPSDSGEDPEHSSVLQERATYNCTDLRANFDQRCWDELDISGYLLNPTTGWNHTVRICSQVENVESNDGADCCKVGEPWTTCYLRLAHGTPGQDCSQINSQFCSYQSGLAPNLDPNIKPEVQYVMKNIYCESVTP